MTLQQIATWAAPVSLVIGLASMVESNIPGFSVPGATMEWMAAAIACAIVGGAHG